MIFLGIESSSDIASVAIVDEDKVLGVHTINRGRNHSVLLAPMVEALLKDTGLSLRDLDGIGVDVGPGSFTGIRIGIALGTALAYGANLPCLGVSSLAALQYAGEKIPGVVVLPLIPARKAEAYGVTQGVEGILDVQELVEVLDSQAKYMLMGEGLEAYRELFRAKGLQLLEMDGDFHLQSGVHIARLGLKIFRRGGVVPGEILRPNYLRKPEAEMNLERKTMELTHD